MAGVNTVGDEGTVVGNQTVPSISETGTAEVVAGGHVSGNRSEGVAYNTDASIGETRTTNGYPAGTDFGESSNPLR